MPLIDRAGTFTGVVVESTLGQTAKSGYPQWVARLVADHMYVNNADDEAHYGITEPGYVEWPGEDSITAFLVLFNDKGPLKNYEQLMAATGWSGQDFQDLTGLTGKRLLFRVEDREYEGKQKREVVWIDSEDAPPERTLKAVDPATAKDLNSKFLSSLKAPVKPAKPVAAKPATPPAKPAVAPSPSTSPAAATPATPPAAAVAAPSAVTPPATGKTAPPKKEKKGTLPPPIPDATEKSSEKLPAETTMAAAWEYVNDPAVKGGNDDTVVADAWIAACTEVGGNRDQSEFTPADWGNIRDTTAKDLGVGK